MSEADGSGRRRSPRRRSLFAGVLVYAEGRQTLDCAVRDISETGARVRVASVMHVEAPAILVIPSQDKAYEVSLIWGRGVEFGLKFLRAADLTAAASDLEKTARRIWLTRRNA